MALSDYAMIVPKVSQQTQCIFDKDVYEIGEKWKPTIEPFGVYYCILCECIAVQRKNIEGNNNRVVAKVHCRNFKNDCPKPTCKNPVLLPERCCKSCPEDVNNIEDLIASQKMEEALLMKNFRKKFYAILSPSSSSSSTTISSNMTTVATRAFFHLNKQRLAFIIKTTSPNKPTFVRFQDLDDTIIEEYIVLGNKSTGSNNQFVIFGSWKKVPKPYRAMIRNRHLKISLSFNNDINKKSSLIGVIRKHNSATHSAIWNDQDLYYELLESNEFGKNKIFRDMLNATSFVSYEDHNSLDRKAMMDQSAYPSMNSINSNYKCYYEAQIYDEGAQWKNQNDDCEMCFCQRGRVKCESEVCLKLRCKEQIRVPGQCCPICKNKLSHYTSNKNQSCYFEGEKRYHLIGSRWHPYIPPFGFDRCTICMCTENAQIKCKRNECPPLPCAERDAYRENPMDCCKKCRTSTRSMESMSDQASNDDNVEQALATGSCRFRGKIYGNGDEWNPAVDPYGEISCIKCRCKDGLHKCQRLKCKPSPPGCQKILIKGECCPVCADEQPKLLSSDNTFMTTGRRRMSTKTSRIRY
ncbi:uncharacterized protein LOC113792860 isoform X2 [Dermatophagoides pteronyssinus]|uniref:Dorsal-ventral patterning protein Sog-like isoform X2 n=1 Tax=Dermatophagoides pteronyssinus TaxID=6956 RepID=A0A6P6XZH4_DERPT|nr:dorsal-ventral patterning protein Sog-like isoform X2 [Dermatophagoides pteronyssinus]